MSTFFMIKLTHGNIRHDAVIVLEKSKTKRRKHPGNKKVMETGGSRYVHFFFYHKAYP